MQAGAGLQDRSPRAQPDLARDRVDHRLRGDDRPTCRSIGGSRRTARSSPATPRRSTSRPARCCSTGTASTTSRCPRPTPRFPSRPRQRDGLHAHQLGLARRPDGNLLISGRNTSALYKIDRSSGKPSCGASTAASPTSRSRPTARFHWQHDARAWSDTQYTVFDNGAKGTEKRSRGLLLDVDEAAQDGRSHAGLPASGGVRVPGAGQRHAAARRSRLRRLGRSAVLLGVRGRRHAAARRPAADQRPLLPGTAWPTGPARRPRSPAIVRTRQPGRRVRDPRQLERRDRGRSLADVLGGPPRRRCRSSAARHWGGFETAIVINSQGPSFQAVALDADGSELGRSEVV